MNASKTGLALPLTTSLCTAGMAQATGSPFALQDLKSGYMLAAADKVQDGKCGEGKCGGKKDAKAKEGKCGGAKSKAGEGKCGGAAGGDAKGKTTEGKCGEGKCGGKK